MRREDTSGSGSLPVPAAPAHPPTFWDPTRAAVHDDEIDLRQVWRVIVRHRTTIFAAFAVAVVTALVATLLMRPTWRATALVEIRPERAPLQLPAVSAPGSLHPRDLLETQARVLRSRSVAAAVIARLGLDRDPELTGAVAQRGFARGLQEIAVTLGLGGPEPDEGARTWTLVESFLDRVEVEVLRDSTLLEVSFESFDPRISADAANAIVTEYLRLGEQRRYEAVSSARRFVGGEIELVRQRLEQSERDLNAFARSQNIVDVEGRSDLVSERVAELSSELTAVVAERIAAESLHRQVASAGLSERTAVLESELVTTLDEQRARLEAEYVRLSRIYKPDYPKLVQIRHEIDQVESSLDREMKRVAAGIHLDFAKARQREALLRTELELEKQGLLDLKDRAVEYHILQREWETNRELHAALLEQMKELDVMSGMELGGVAVIDHARAPLEPHGPRLGLNLAFGGGLGLLIGLVLAFLLNHLDDVVRVTRDLEAIAGLPSLGSVPKVSDNSIASEHVSQVSRWSPAAEALRSIRTNLLLAPRQKPLRVIQVTSALMGEGKTMTSANLAILLAQPGARVLLIDGDLRRPRLHAVFDVPEGPGLADVLRGGRDVEPRVTAVENLWLLPAGTLPENPAELLSSLNMEVLLESVGETFDYVILDSAPLLPLTDSALMSTRVDGVVMVVSAQQTRREAVAQAVERLRRLGAPLVGTVLNMAEPDEGETAYYGAYYGSDRGAGASASTG